MLEIQSMKVIFVYFHNLGIFLIFSSAALSFYSYCSRNYCDSNSCCSFMLVIAIEKSNGNLFGIASKTERVTILAIVGRAILYTQKWIKIFFTQSPKCSSYWHDIVIPLQTSAVKGKSKTKIKEKER